MAFDDQTTCGDKVAYATRGKAWDVLLRLRRKNAVDWSLGVYHCPACFGWHLGGQGFHSEAFVLGGGRHRQRQKKGRRGKRRRAA